MKILPVILSGGSGTRLWPLSRSDYPKQLQRLVGNLSLLQQTAQRLKVGGEILPPVVVCGDDQRFLVAEQLREAGIKPGVIVLEPVPRSTAPALAVAALWAKEPSDTVLVAMPADHFIADNAAFAAAVRQAAAVASRNRLMILGLKPTSPHTGFGYIEQGAPLSDDGAAFAVKQFKEKPDACTAQHYLESGTFLWNAGIFVFRADLYLAAIDRFEPSLGLACRAALDKAKSDLDFLRLDKDTFSQSPSISVDYGVLERSSNIGVLPVSFGWSDIGGWKALWQIAEKDAQQNITKGDVIVRESSDCYIQSDKRLIAAIGVKDLVIVDTADALFVATKDKADEVKDIVEVIKKQGRRECKEHLRVWRPWGSYERINEGPRFQVKRIAVKPGGKLSLQKHHHRAEHWVIVSGTAKVQCGEETKLLGPNESIYIPLGVKHRLENPGLVPLNLIEVQSGDYLGEDDIVRFEDVYARTSETTAGSSSLAKQG